MSNGARCGIYGLRMSSLGTRFIRTTSGRKSDWKPGHYERPIVGVGRHRRTREMVSAWQVSAMSIASGVFPRPSKRASLSTPNGKSTAKKRSPSSVTSVPVGEGVLTAHPYESVRSTTAAVKTHPHDVLMRRSTVLLLQDG